MKTLNKFILSLGVVALAGGMSSCVDDLDLLPTDPNTLTPADFAKDPEGYMTKVMGDVYLQFATQGANGSASVQGFDGGMSTFQRSTFILEEIPTDEATWLATNDVDYGKFQYGVIPSSNRAVFGTYSRLMINVTVCNSFIQTVQEGYFNLTTDELKAKADEYIRQCKILRSAAYFYLISDFGNPPYADENVAIGAIPSQLGSAGTYQRVVDTLEEVVAAYPAQQTPAFGYVGKEVAQALLVKYYLNAEAFGAAPAYDKCLAVANQIIANHKGAGFQNSGLAEYYQGLFAHNNYNYAPGDCTGVYTNAGNAINAAAPKEIIWYIPQNEEHLFSYANGDFMLQAWAGEIADMGFSGSDKYNANSGWKCATARTQFTEVFDWNEPTMETSADQRVALWTTAADGFLVTNDVLDQDHYGSNGYLPVKYSNWNFDLDGSYSAEQPANVNHPSIGVPMIRLAEIYLSAAEAILHGAGDKNQAVEYVNYIRERAGLTPWSSAELGLTSLQEERQRELYTESTRRTDLIRYGKWISGYNWNWKNEAKNGRDFDESFRYYPIPSQFVALGGYKQNPGY